MRMAQKDPPNTTNEREQEHVQSNGGDLDKDGVKATDEHEPRLRFWLSDFAIMTFLVGVIFAELVLHDGRHIYVYVVAAVLLFPFVSIHVGNFMRLTAHPALWRFLLVWLTRLRLSIPLTFGSWAGIVIAMEAEGTPKIAFFNLCAQIIPVLALVLAIEGRFFRVGFGKAPGRLVLLLYTFAAMAYGEYVSLHAVAYETIGKYDLPTVSAVLITAFTALALLALLGPMMGVGNWDDVPEEVASADRPGP